MGRGPVPGHEGLATGPQTDTQIFIQYNTWIWYSFHINLSLKISYG